MGRVLSRGELVAQVEADRAAGRTVAFANGCFDLLHVGHVRYLQAAAREADRLVVAINDDRFSGIQLAPVLCQIEHEFGRPVIASNQALVWHCLHLLGLPDRPAGYGTLLAGAFDSPSVT